MIIEPLVFAQRLKPPITEPAGAFYKIAGTCLEISAMIYLYAMDVDKKEAEIIESAIQFWSNEGIVDSNIAERMRSGINIRESNGSILSMYAFIAAVSCALLAFGALVMDEKWIELLRRRFGFSEVLVACFFALLTVVFIYFGHKRRKKSLDVNTANETYNILIVMSLAVSMAYFGRSIGYGQGNYALILLATALVYGWIGFFLRSKLLWITMLMTLTGWWAVQTYYWSGGGDYFLGMNYPLRMTLYGGVILMLSYFQRHVEPLGYFHKITCMMGWLFLLTSAWTLSIFGNSSSFDAWLQIRQGRMWYWALSFSLLLIGLIVYAFRKKDDFLRDLCLVFFLVNIYTRYFEYFWDKTNKGLFFALLAISFWWIGRSAGKWRKQQVD